MYCKQCGCMLRDAMTFCPRCGTPTVRYVVPTRPPVQPQARMPLRQPMPSQTPVWPQQPVPSPPQTPYIPARGARRNGGMPYAQNVQPVCPRKKSNSALAVLLVIVISAATVVALRQYGITTPWSGASSQSKNDHVSEVSYDYEEEQERDYEDENTYDYNEEYTYDYEENEYDTGYEELEEEEAGPIFDSSLPVGQQSYDLSRATWPGDDHGYWHAVINDRARSIYDELYPHILARDADFTITATDTYDDDFRLANRCIELDHPELFWFHGGGDTGMYYKAKEPGDGVRITGYTYEYTEEQIPQLQQQLDAAVNDALAQIPSGGSDYERALATFEWLANNVEYAGDGKENSYKYQTVISSLVNRDTVCAGYTKAYQLLLTRMGIPCTYVKGHDLGEDEENDPGHAWNLVCLGGRMGHTDATWGDSQYTSGKKFINYKYFFMDDAMLGSIEQHIPDSWCANLLPTCNSVVLLNAEDL